MFLSTGKFLILFFSSASVSRKKKQTFVSDLPESKYFSCQTEINYYLSSLIYYIYLCSKVPKSGRVVLLMQWWGGGGGKRGRIRMIIDSWILKYRNFWGKYILICEKDLFVIELYHSVYWNFIIGFYTQRTNVSFLVFYLTKYY